MNHINRSTRARINASILSFAVTVIAVVAMTTASEHPVRPAPASDQGHAQRARAATGGGIPAIPPGMLVDDPEMLRTDRSNEHHG